MGEVVTVSNEISFMGANLVAQRLDWNMTGGWGEGARATNEYYAPAESFRARFDELLTDVVEMGFGFLDVWTAQLNWAWATDEHLGIARELLDQHGVRVASYGGGFGETAEEFDQACRVARAIGTSILGGGTKLLGTVRRAVVKTLDTHEVYLAIENHAEKTPAEMLTKIGDGAGGRIGTAVDTGWYGTQGYNAARAIEELGTHLHHLHLKDVQAIGSHLSCRYGDGIVPVRDCVHAAVQAGYSGSISIEHEPAHFNPREDCIANNDQLQNWLTQTPSRPADS